MIATTYQVKKKIPIDGKLHLINERVEERTPMFRHDGVLRLHHPVKTLAIYEKIFALWPRVCSYLLSQNLHLSLSLSWQTFVLICWPSEGCRAFVFLKIRFRLIFCTFLQRVPWLTKRSRYAELLVLESVSKLSSLYLFEKEYWHTNWKTQAGVIFH